MKYAIIIPDGAADEPLAELGGKTPIEAANTPNMDRIAMEGRQGLVRTVPEGFESGSDVATMCLLGYDPAVYHTGRAPLEAAAQQIPLSPTDWVFRCNLVTVIDGIMKDHSAGGITNAEAQAAASAIFRASVESARVLSFTTASATAICWSIAAGKNSTSRPSRRTKSPRKPIAKYLPRGKGSEVLRQHHGRSRELFADHEINQVRQRDRPQPRNAGLALGPGPRAQYAEIPGALRRQNRLHDHRRRSSARPGGAAGLGRSRSRRDDQLSRHQLRRPGRATAAMLDKYDLVFSHIEAPDEARIRRIGKPKSPPSSTSTSTSLARFARSSRVPGVANPGHARSSDQYRHAQARLCAEPFCDGRDTRAKRGARPLL